MLSTPAVPPEGSSASAGRLHLPRSFRPRGLSPPRRLTPRPTRSKDRVVRAPKSTASDVRRHLSSPASRRVEPKLGSRSSAGHIVSGLLHPDFPPGVRCISLRALVLTKHVRALQPASGMTSSAIGSAVRASVDPSRARPCVGLSRRLPTPPPARWPGLNRQRGARDPSSSLQRTHPSKTLTDSATSRHRDRCLLGVALSVRPAVPRAAQLDWGTLRCLPRRVGLQVPRISLKQGGYLRLTSQNVSEETSSSAVTRSLPNTRSGVETRLEPPSRRSSIDESVVRFLVSKTSALCSSWASGPSSLT